MDNKVKEYFELIANIKDNNTCTLTKDGVYHIWQDECEHVYGYHASNTATKEENPLGERFVAMYVKNKKNVIIDGNNATLLIHGIMTPLLFDSCENITLKNFTIDYVRPTMNEYYVEQNDGKTCILKMNEDCLYEIQDGELYFCGEKKKNGEPFWKTKYKGDDMLSMYCDPRTEKIRFLKNGKGDRFPSVPTIEKAEDLGAGRVRITWKEQGAFLPEGSIIQTRDVSRKQFGGLFQYCKNLRLENVKIRFMHGFGLLCQYCDNVTYDRLDCTPKQGRTIACNADFFHFSGCKGEILIENCTAAGAHDDFINVHGTHLQIVQANALQKSIVVRFANPNSWGYKAFFENDEIEFIKWNTLLPYATNKVLKVEYISEKEIKLYLDQTLPEIELGKDVVENSTWTPTLTVRNNYFGPSMGRGILCTTRKKITIEENTFYKTGGSVLYVEGDCNFWFESGYTREVFFCRNTLQDCAYGTGAHQPPIIYVAAQVIEESLEPQVHGLVVIKDNRFLFEKGAKNEMYFRFTKQVICENNIFEERLSPEKGV